MRISDLEIDPELERLLEQARHHVMTDEERREQRISFAYGNLVLHNPNITKDDIRRAAREMEKINEYI